MSSCIVPVVTISKLSPHPNADKLELAEVNGWQVVVGKGQFKEGDLLVHFPPDVILRPMIAHSLGVLKYLKGPKQDRVGMVKLRGEPSFGFLAPIPDAILEEVSVTGGALTKIGVGDNLADFFMATKYEPPVRLGCGDAAPTPPGFSFYTDIENMRNFPDVLHTGERVVVTEKIHGTNFASGIWMGNRIAASRRTVRKESPNSLYWLPWKDTSFVDAVNELSEGGARNVVFYGEIFGPGVQALHYGLSKPWYNLFDLSIDGRYVDFCMFEKVCERYGLPRVPTIMDGFFHLEDIKRLSNGTTTVGGASHTREGVVVRPIVERTDPKVGRVILKYVGDDYLFGHSHEDIGES